VKGWRIAWTPDLAGLIPVDREVAEVAERGARVFRTVGAAFESASPDFSETNDIVLSTRGLMMAALHADKLEEWCDQMQPGLVWNIEQGLRLTPQEIGRGEKLRTLLWHRVRVFFERYDLLVLPTVAVKPFPVEQPYPAEINGRPLANYTQWFFLTYAISLTGLPAISVPCGFTKDGLPVGLQIVVGAGRRRPCSPPAAALERAAPWADKVPPIVNA